MLFIIQPYCDGCHDPRSCLFVLFVRYPNQPSNHGPPLVRSSPVLMLSASLVEEGSTLAVYKEAPGPGPPAWLDYQITRLPIGPIKVAGAPERSQPRLHGQQQKKHCHHEMKIVLLMTRVGLSPTVGIQSVRRTIDKLKKRYRAHPHRELDHPHAANVCASTQPQSDKDKIIDSAF
jgi:hypothetical protein